MMTAIALDPAVLALGATFIVEAALLRAGDGPFSRIIMKVLAGITRVPGGGTFRRTHQHGQAFGGRLLHLRARTVTAVGQGLGLGRPRPKVRARLFDHGHKLPPIGLFARQLRRRDDPTVAVRDRLRVVAIADLRTVFHPPGLWLLPM